MASKFGAWQLPLGVGAGGGCSNQEETHQVNWSTMFYILTGLCLIDIHSLYSGGKKGHHICFMYFYDALVS